MLRNGVPKGLKFDLRASVGSNPTSTKVLNVKSLFPARINNPPRGFSYHGQTSRGIQLKLLDLVDKISWSQDHKSLDIGNDLTQYF